MIPDVFAKTLLVANPVAQSGRGERAAKKAASLLRKRLGSACQLDVLMTQHAGHARQHMAQHASNYSAVVALGGDGIIHEVANGLMTLPREQRPCLGVVPVGSGNDYAKTLGMSLDVAKAIDQLMDADVVAADMGCCNGEYFTETLSFGLDAAIALGTEERRKKKGKAGTMLYLEEGIDQLFHHLNTYDMSLEVPGEHALNARVVLLAVQVGPTYGGGFAICPQARIDDGLLDVCVAHGPIGVLRATKVFLSAKNGHHVGHKVIQFLQTETLNVRFEGLQPQCQIDGERLQAESYEVHVLSKALRVLKASK